MKNSVQQPRSAREWKKSSLDIKKKKWGEYSINNEFVIYKMNNESVIKCMNVLVNICAKYDEMKTKGNKIKE